MATVRVSRAVISLYHQLIRGQDIRSEMTSVLADMGVPVEKHHHEVAPSQHELGVEFGTLLETADNMQLYKYCVHSCTCLWRVSHFHAKANRWR